MLSRHWWHWSSIITYPYQVKIYLIISTLKYQSEHWHYDTSLMLPKSLKTWPQIYASGVPDVDVGVLTLPFTSDNIPLCSWFEHAKYISLCISHRGNISSRFSSKSNASELLENLEEIFPLYSQWSVDDEQMKWNLQQNHITRG